MHEFMNDAYDQRSLILFFHLRGEATVIYSYILDLNSVFVVTLTEGLSGYGRKLENWHEHAHGENMYRN